jgi:membrane fusion protein (multidrug efflux system)
MKPTFRLLLFILFATCCLAQQAVEVVQIVPKQVDSKLRLPGEILPYQSVEIYARVAGYVEDVLVDKGSTVKKGQLLVRLSAPELNAQRAEAESKIQGIESQRVEAEARLIGAQATYAKLHAASRTPGAVADNELVLAKQSVDAMRATISVHTNAAKAAAASVETLRRLESFLDVAAPFDGVITERLVHPGALVGPGGGARSLPMLRVEQHARLRLVVPVPETAVSAIANGAKVAFTVTAYPDETFYGQVARIPGNLDPKTRSMAVELDVSNPNGHLGPGMYPEVQWLVHKARPSFFVPSTSVVTTTERMFVIRVANGHALYVPVSRGTVSADQVEVFGKLAAGDLIVRRATDEIREGSAVSVKKQSTGLSP